MTDLTEAIRERPKSPDAYAVRSLIYARQGDQANAAADRKTLATLSAAPSESDEDAECAAVLHRTSLRLVPALEKP